MNFKELGVCPRYVETREKLHQIAISPYDTYPVHFFIPKGRRDEDTVRYINQNSSKEEILEFIKTIF